MPETITDFGLVLLEGEKEEDLSFLSEDRFLASLQVLASMLQDMF